MYVKFLDKQDKQTDKRRVLHFLGEGKTLIFANMLLRRKHSSLVRSAVAVLRWERRGSSDSPGGVLIVLLNPDSVYCQTGTKRSILCGKRQFVIKPAA